MAAINKKCKPKIENKILHIAVFKACPIGEKKPKQLRITADQCFDDLPQEARETWSNQLLMQNDAQKIYDAFMQTLPQGTIARLTVLLLDRAKSDLIVSIGN